MKLTLIVDYMPRGTPSPNIRTYEFNLSNILRSKGEIYDELKMTYENDIIEAKVIRRCDLNKYGILNILEEPIEEIIEMPQIELFEGINYIYISEFPDLPMSITYLKNNPLNKAYPSRFEMQTKIQQTADNILLKVFQKDKAEELITYLNLTAGKAKLASKLIELEGLVTANENFKILLDGSMVAVNGSFKGYVEADSGSFKGSIEADSGYFNGDIYLKGKESKIISDNGMLTTKIIEANTKSVQFVGGTSLLPIGFSMYAQDSSGNPLFLKDFLEFNFEIPTDFKVVKAYIILDHVPVRYSETGTYKRTGYSRKLKLYKSSSKLSSSVTLDYGYYTINSNSSFNEIEGAFGSDGFTGSTTGSSKQSIDITSYIDEGFNFFKIESADTTPTSYEQSQQKTGACKATLYINGYTQFS